MAHSDSDQPTPPLPDLASVPTDGGEVGTQPDRSVRRQPLAGILFGAFVGMLVGAPVGAGYCWLLGVPEYRWQGALIGAALGPLGGALIGWRGRQTGTNIATIVCAVYGLLPGLILIGAAGIVRGNFSLFLFVGLLSIGPMFGLMLGAMFDRAFDEAHKNAWGKAVGFGMAGVAVCLGLSYAIITPIPGLDPEELAQQVRPLILKDWKKQPGLRGATIRNITLATEDGKLYKGFVEAAIDGAAERFSLEVVVAGNYFQYTLEPLNE